MLNSIFCILTAVLAISISTPAFAQPAPATDDLSASNTKKLFIQLTIDGQSLLFNEDNLDETDNGGGLTLRAGWGISRLATLYLGFQGARIDGETNGIVNEEYDWGGFELGSRFNFRSGKPFVPYVDVALRAVAAIQEDIDLEFQGGGITIGGGVAYFLSPHISLDAGLRFGFGGFDEVRFGPISVEVDPDTFGYGERRFSIGMTFYPLN